MVKKRAPNCPSLSLPEAIEKVERVYTVEGKNTFNGDTAVKHIGYNGLNGASRRALGALRSYGLISGKGDDLRVSDDAIVIIADAQSPDQNERQGSLRECLIYNRVLADLVKQFGQSSTQLIITSYLQKQYGFKARAARRTAKLYKESVTLIHWGATDSSVAAEKLSYDALGNFVKPLQSTGCTEIDFTDSPSRQEEPVSNSKEESFALDEGNVALIWPGGMSPESFEDFTDWLLIMHRRIGRDVNGQPHVLLEKKDKIG